MRAMTDSPISFPGLFGDWEFTMSSKALDIGGGIYWYGILIALGLILAVCFAMTQRHKYGITEDNILDAVLWGIPFGVIGARAYYVIFYLDQFRDAEGKLDFRQEKDHTAENVSPEFQEDRQQHSEKDMSALLVAKDTCIPQT